MRCMKKNIAAILVIGILAAIFFVCSARSLDEELEIYDKTLRLHILANSDSEADQKLKLEVRDAILEALSKEINLCETKEQAEALILNKKQQIEDVAEAVIRDHGMDYSATLSLTVEEYPKRSYDGITLPAGKYTSVRILLGKSEGQNWWCVLFPQVCTDTAAAAEEKMAQVGFTPNQIRLLTEQEKPVYRFKFKIIELVKELVG